MPGRGGNSRSVLRKHPGHFDGLHLMSILEAQRGHYKDAEKLVRQALLINPNSPDAQSNRGNMLRELGDYAGAVACYDVALRLKPQYPQRPQQPCDCADRAAANSRRLCRVMMRPWLFDPDSPRRSTTGHRPTPA